jgi:hypothetical protein
MKIGTDPRRSLRRSAFSTTLRVENWGAETGWARASRSYGAIASRRWWARARRPHGWASKRRQGPRRSPGVPSVQGPLDSLLEPSDALFAGGGGVREELAVGLIVGPVLSTAWGIQKPPCRSRLGGRVAVRLRGVAVTFRILRAGFSRFAWRSFTTHKLHHSHRRRGPLRLPLWVRLSGGAPPTTAPSGSFPSLWRAAWPSALRRVVNRVKGADVP